MNKRSVVISALFLAAVILLLIFSKKPDTYKFTRMQLGTVINITIIADSESDASEASEQAFMEIERIEDLMSPYRNGDIRNINIDAYNKPVKLSTETFDLIEKADEISGITGGSFDITFASISKLWNFNDKQFILPDKAILKSLLPAFNYKNIILNKSGETIRFKNRQTKIGLGGIAKGYAIKRGNIAMENRGIKNSILEAGGDIQVLGDKFGKSWEIGLKHPRKDDLVLSVLLKDMDSIASSGDYERFVMHNGKRYHHILDPRTGFPARTFASVSVISKDPVDADTYATAFFVMGKERAIKLLKDRNDLKAIFIDLDMKLSASAELRNVITLFEKEDIEWF